MLMGTFEKHGFHVSVTGNRNFTNLYSALNIQGET
jgi:hypothetical protein